MIKNSQPFGKNFQKTVGGDFFDSHCTLDVVIVLASLLSCSILIVPKVSTQLSQFVVI